MGKRTGKGTDIFSEIKEVKMDWFSEEMISKGNHSRSNKKISSSLTLRSETISDLTYQDHAK